MTWAVFLVHDITLLRWYTVSTFHSAVSQPSQQGDITPPRHLADGKWLCLFDKTNRRHLVNIFLSRVRLLIHPPLLSRSHFSRPVEFLRIGWYRVQFATHFFFIVVVGHRLPASMATKKGGMKNGSVGMPVGYVLHDAHEKVSCALRRCRHIITFARSYRKHFCGRGN